MYFADAGGSFSTQKPAMFAHQKPVVRVVNKYLRIYIAVNAAANIRPYGRIVYDLVYKLSVVATFYH
jgi:hypothetical protein